MMEQVAARRPDGRSKRPTVSFTCSIGSASESVANTETVAVVALHPWHKLHVYIKRSIDAVKRTQVCRCEAL